MRGRLLGAPALVLLLLAQGAAAQALTFGAPVVEGQPVVPDRQEADLSVPVSFQCGADGAWLSDGSLHVDAPTADRDGVIVTGSGQAVIPQSACMGAASQRWEGTLRFKVAATRAAPGETLIRLHIRGYVPAQGTAAAAQAEVEGQVHVAYQGLITATVPVTIAAGAPGSELVFNVTVENLGNSASLVGFSLVDEASPGWAAAAPDSVRLESAQQGGAHTGQTVPFRVRLPTHPGLTDSQQAFRLRAQPASLLDPTQRGNEVVVSVLARVQGCSPLGDGESLCPQASGAAANTLPAAVAPLVALVLLGCAAVVRRR